MGLRTIILSLAAVVVLAVVLRYFGSDGLPFDRGDVTEVRFRYSYEDTTEVVVEDYEQVQRIMSTLRLRPQGPTLCIHISEVVLTVNGVQHVASICGNCFDLKGEYHGYFEMPSEFAEQMLAYRDSASLRRHWDGRSAR